MLLRTFKLLKLLLNFKIIPGLINQHYMIFTIYALNKFEVDSSVFKAAAEYTIAYIKISNTDFYFLKTWKSKINADRYYKESKLDSFIEITGDKKEVYKMFVNKLE
jgi:hypothetical protein